MAPPADGANASFDGPSYHIPQRTLDLRCDSAYFRVRMELSGESAAETSSRQTFQTAVTHALVRAHGVVGGAIPIEHLGFFAPAAAATATATTTSGGEGIIKCHVDDVDVLRSSLSLLTETHEGRGCRLIVVDVAETLTRIAKPTTSRTAFDAG